MSVAGGVCRWRRTRTTSRQANRQCVQQRRPSKALGYKRTFCSLPRMHASQTIGDAEHAWEMIAKCGAQLGLAVESVNMSQWQ